MLKKSIKQFIFLLFLSHLLIMSSSCSSIVSSTAKNLAANLSKSILNSDDLKTVEDGAPAYLLLIDSFLIDAENDIDLLQSASKLYAAYAGVFVSDPKRAIRMSNRSLTYAAKALCLSNHEFCQLQALKFNDFSLLMPQINQNNLNDWYIFASAWAAWIKANSSDVSAIVQLAKVQLVMEHIILIDNNWDNGMVHLYLGVFKTLIPPALGGKPEQAKRHFSQAIDLSQGKNLMIKVLYAKKYARLVFDQQLHDKLLKEVLDADPQQANLTLMNTLAQKKAAVQLDSSNDYFE